MKVAYQGVAGAFSHQACLAFLPDHEPVAEPTFEAVIEAVVDGRANRGVLPLENIAAGPVPGVRLLIENSSLQLISEHLLPIRVHLLGLPGSALGEITTVVSHPIALRQCSRWLERLLVRTEDAPNTAVAAASLQDPSRAVLASEAAAGTYGLEFLLRDVHDSPENATLFAVVGLPESAIPGGDQ